MHKPPIGQQEFVPVPSARHDLPHVLTLREAAELLRIDPRSVRDLFVAGEIEGNRHGRLIRLSTASVLAWVRGGQR